MFLDKTFSRHKILLGPKVFRPEIFLDPKKISNSNFLHTQNCLRHTISFKPKVFLNQIFKNFFFGSKFFWTDNFFKKISRLKIYFGLKFIFSSSLFSTPIFFPEFLDQKIYWFQKKILNQNFFGPKLFQRKLFFTQNFLKPNFF